MKFFNTAGPIKTDIHYYLDLLERINYNDIKFLIEQEKYFILHAPRQTGKTSCLIGLRDYLNTEGKYHCIYFNVEEGQTARHDVERGVRTILGALAQQIRFSHPKLVEKFPDYFSLYDKIPGDKLLGEVLNRFSMNLDKPLILMIDEIDALVGDTLISVLRQLRSGYLNRPKGFPQSIILCGVRDVQDYRIHSDKEKMIIAGGSAFNIKAKSITLENFQKEEIKKLYLKHTEETGQIFEDDVIDYVWELTEGQPWLVNALAYEVAFEIEKDRSKPITKEHIESAKENMILRRDTHIDILIDKLSEARVQKVIEPILYSEEETENLSIDDLKYVADLGLIKKEEKKYRISNAIYKEVIPRELVYATQYTMSIEPVWFIENNKLQLDKLLKRFQQFYRENSEVWLEKFAYKEAGPHLLLTAFLQRIINGGGRIHREYGLGRKRIDLFIEFGGEKFCIETKVFRTEKSKQDGLSQLKKYMDVCGAKAGHLILFDKSSEKKWDEKIFFQKFNEYVS
ncbi:MAG TPA: AAA-like domain-containing protein, partial [bacterium]|nr:AAA-like domain-containing protein [bacterium]